MAAGARLTLPDYAADLGDRQLFAPEQRDQPQPGRLGDRAQRADERVEPEIRPYSVAGIGQDALALRQDGL